MAYKFETETLVIKFVTGEVIISEIVEKGDKTITLRNPYALAFQGQNLVMLPFTYPVFDLSELIVINNDTIMAWQKANDNLVTEYRAKVAGIKTAKGL